MTAAAVITTTVITAAGISRAAAKHLIAGFQHLQPTTTAGFLLIASRCIAAGRQCSSQRFLSSGRRGRRYNKPTVGAHRQFARRCRAATVWSGNSAVFAAPSRRRSLFHVSVTEKEMRPPIGPPSDGGGLLLVLSGDRCLLLILSVNGCLLLVLSDHRCLLLVRSNDRCLLLVLFDERCLLLVRFNDRCLLLVLSDGRCLLLVLSDNKCLLLVLFDNRCLLLVHTGTRTAPEARRKVCKSLELPIW